MRLGWGARKTEVTKRRLLAATDFMAHTSFRSWSTISSFGWRMLTWSDPGGKQHEAIAARGDDTIEARAIDDRLYLRLSAEVKLPAAGKGWHELDRSRIPSSFTFSFGPPGKREPTNSDGLIGTIISGRLRRQHASGMVDMVKVGALGGFTPSLVGRPQSGHLEAPFHAALDSDGRLASFHIEQTSKSPTITVLYADFGIGVEVSSPQASIAAPDDLYTALEAAHRRRRSTAPSAGPGDHL